MNRLRTLVFSALALLAAAPVVLALTAKPNVAPVVVSPGEPLTRTMTITWR